MAPRPTGRRASHKKAQPAKELNPPSSQAQTVSKRRSASTVSELDNQHLHKLAKKALSTSNSPAPKLRLNGPKASNPTSPRQRSKSKKRRTPEHTPVRDTEEGLFVTEELPNVAPQISQERLQAGHNLLDLSQDVSDHLEFHLVEEFPVEEVSASSQDKDFVYSLKLYVVFESEKTGSYKDFWKVQYSDSDGKDDDDNNESELQLYDAHRKAESWASEFARPKDWPFHLTSIQAFPIHNKLRKEDKWPINLGLSVYAALRKWKDVIQRLKDFNIDGKNDLQLQLNFTYHRRKDQTIPPPVVPTSSATKSEPALTQTERIVALEREKSAKEGYIKELADNLAQRLECKEIHCKSGGRWCYVDSHKAHHKVESLQIRQWAIIEDSHSGVYNEENPPSWIKTALLRTKRSKKSNTLAEQPHPPPPPPYPYQLSYPPFMQPYPAFSQWHQPAQPSLPTISNASEQELQKELAKRQRRQKHRKTRAEPIEEPRSSPVKGDLEEYIEFLKATRPAHIHHLDDAFIKLSDAAITTEQIQSFKSNDKRAILQELGIPVGIALSLIDNVSRWGKQKSAIKRDVYSYSEPFVPSTPLQRLTYKPEEQGKEGDHIYISSEEDDFSDMSETPP
ncbi:MAG: hypothetical protein Q9190_008020 [Brigantiaea leucoxantha]